MINVVNKYKEPNHVYCGRGSALGNPFPMLNESERDEVCDMYEEWFYKHIDEPNFLQIVDDFNAGINKQVSAQMRQLIEIFNAAGEIANTVNLGCFCAPKRCHCDTIKQFVENKLDELWK